MCHIVFVFFLGANVFLSPPYPIPCPRRDIASELLKKQQAPRVIDTFKIDQKEV